MTYFVTYFSVATEIEDEPLKWAAREEGKGGRPSQAGSCNLAQAADPGTNERKKFFGIRPDRGSH
jgi:hypothetical protein